MSPNGGQSWLPAAVDIKNPQFTFDPAEIDGGSNVMFRVLASAGLNSTSADVGPIEVVQVPTVQAEKAILDFGNQLVGTKPEQVLTIKNPGSGPLAITGITSSNDAFRLGLTSPPLTVPAGASRTFEIQWSVDAVGPQSATLRISSTDPNQPQLDVKVQGVGVTSGSAVAPVISISPTALDFGTVSSGQTKDLILAIRNEGNSTLTVNSITSSNARFGLVILSTPFNVGAGSFQNATIRFSPIAAGPQTGTITIVSNDPARPSVVVNVLGTGTGGEDSTPDPNVLKVDDGTFEVLTGFNQGGVQGYFVNRLTPASYPATLRKVILLFAPSGPPLNGLPLNSTIQLISASTRALRIS